MEIWKDIEGYEGLYQVSNLGRVRSLNYNHTGNPKLLKLSLVRSGYNQCQLWNGGCAKMVLVHRLVAEAFIPNPDDLPQVNHKNEIKADNRVVNLEWCTSKYNMNYGTGVERNKISQPRKQKIMIDDILFQCINDAAKYLSVQPPNIHKALNNNQTTFKGHKIERVS